MSCPVLANRLVGFWRSQLIWICSVCHLICEFLSKTRIKWSDWLEIRSGHGILIYSAWEGFISKSFQTYTYIQCTRKLNWSTRNCTFGHVCLAKICIRLHSVWSDFPGCSWDNSKASSSGQGRLWPDGTDMQAEPRLLYCSYLMVNFIILWLFYIWEELWENFFFSFLFLLCFFFDKC